MLGSGRDERLSHRKFYQPATTVAAYAHQEVW